MRMPARITRSTLALAALLLAGGCGGGGPGTSTETFIPSPDLWPGAVPGEPVAERSGCGVLVGPATPGAKLVVALGDSVEPAHAPVPRNPSERLVFAHLYETLVRVDCAGEAQPGLAESWSCTEDSTVWVFRLRADARFWDGTRVTADEVRQAWTAGRGALRNPDGTDPWTWFDPRDGSITTLDARRLAIRLPEPQARFPLLLAHPATAVAVPRKGWTWPVGSGICRLRATDPVPRPDLECRANLHHPRAPAWTRLTFRVVPGADPRDLIGRNPDLMIVRETEDVRFYRQAPGYEAHPLPWDRLYLLVLPPEANPEGGRAWLAAADRIDPRRDVTLVDARSWYDIVLPGGGTEACPQTSGPIASGNSARLDWNLERKKPGPSTLMYPAGMVGARELAHRLVALAGKPARAESLAPDGIQFVLQWQMTGAVILPLDLAYPTGCLQLATLLGKAAWLQDAALGGGDSARAPNSLGDAERLATSDPSSPTERLHRLGLVRPLGLSRPWLIARNGLAGLDLDFDGTPRLEGLGPAVPTATP